MQVQIGHLKITLCIFAKSVLKCSIFDFVIFSFIKNQVSLLPWKCRIGSCGGAVRLPWRCHMVAVEGVYGSCKRPVCPVYCPLGRIHYHPVFVPQDSGQTVLLQLPYSFPYGTSTATGVQFQKKVNWKKITIQKVKQLFTIKDLMVFCYNQLANNFFLIFNR